MKRHFGCGRSVAVVGGDGGSAGPALYLKQRVNDVRWVFSDNAEGIADFVGKPRITEGEHDVAGRFSRPLAVENEVLRNVCHVGVFCRPVTHCLTLDHGG